MRNAELHMMAGLGSILLTAAIVVPTVFLANTRDLDNAPLEDMEVIEASLAYKAPNAKPKPKQPQKEMNQPVPEVKPEGVSRDENKVPDEKKDEKKPEPPKKDEVVDPLAKYRRDQDPDNQTGTTVPDSADIGSEFGRGNISKGDPFFQRLWADLAWEVPELAKVGGSPTIACVVMAAEGKITRIKFKSRGEDDVATLADKAMNDLKAKRNANPEEVPTHLLNRLTGPGICFNLTAN